MKPEEHTINYYKLQAKRLKRELNIQYIDALNTVAQKYGFSNWTDCQRQCNNKSLLHEITIEPLTFTIWLQKQKNRQSPLGDLARAMIADTNWPLNENLDGYFDYLNNRGASKEAVTALKNSWKSYNNYLNRNLLPKEKIISKKARVRKTDERKIVIVKNVQPIHFDKRSVEVFKTGDKAWISWNGRKALPVTITEVTEQHYSFVIERPLKHKGNEHYLFLDEVRSTPELACINKVTS
ncbi:MAG: hypothetical protein J0L47_11190 [Flavobacteriales bacterium]|jgi:hypothetical protein|nr:hypothetical protein [Flavobacteriales bacterium]MCA0392351.1 YozE family protein [Bacteroidota bacterium]